MEIKNTRRIKLNKAELEEVLKQALFPTHKPEDIELDWAYSSITSLTMELQETFPVHPVSLFSGVAAALATTEETFPLQTPPSPTSVEDEEWPELISENGQLRAKL